MLVSHKKKFIFIKSVKTASTSVEVFFEKYCTDDENWEPQHHRCSSVSPAGIIGSRGPNGRESKYYNHMPAKEIKDLVGDRLWEDYFKFTVVRNPYDKMVSAFYHFEMSRNPEKYRFSKESDIELFRNWVKNGGKLADRHIYCIDEEEVVDFYIRYDRLNEGIKTVCEKLKLDFNPEMLPKLKGEFRNKRYKTRDFYDSETAASVQSLFEFEIQRFDFKLY